MYVKHIESNIKGGLDQELGEKTLIVGPNGRGKSAIVNAVELALGGSASDIVGRDEVKREADLLALTQGETLKATATLDAGDTATIEIQPNGRGGAKKAKRDCDILSSFPVRDVRAALGGSPDTARKWLLSRVASGVTREDVLAWFSPEGADLYNILAKQVHGSEIDRLLGVLASAASDVRSKKKEISTIKEVLERSGSTLDTEPTAAMISDAETLTHKALADYEESMKNSHYGVVEESVRTLTQEAERSIEALSVAQADWDLIKDLDPPGDRPTDKQLDVVDRIQAIRGIHQMHRDLEVEGCLVCMRDGTIDHADLAQTKGAIIQGIHAVQEWWEVRDRVAGSVEEASTRAVAAVEAANEAKATLQSLSQPEEDGNDKKSIWEAAHMRETALKEVAKQWKVIRSQREETRILRADISNLEEVIDGSKQAVSRLLKMPSTLFPSPCRAICPSQMCLNSGSKKRAKKCAAWDSTGWVSPHGAFRC